MISINNPQDALALAQAARRQRLAATITPEGGDRVEKAMTATDFAAEYGTGYTVLTPQGLKDYEAAYIEKGVAGGEKIEDLTNEVLDLRKGIEVKRIQTADGIVTRFVKPVEKAAEQTAAE